MIGRLSIFNSRTCDWNIFKRRMENYFIANDIVDHRIKRDLFLNSLSRNTYSLLYDLINSGVPESKSYQELITFMSEYYKPQSSVFKYRHQFYASRMKYFESIQDWAARVQKLSAFCEFEPRQYAIKFRDQFIIGLGRGSIQDRLFEEDITLTFEEAVNIATVKSAAYNYRYDIYLRGNGRVDEWGQEDRAHPEEGYLV